MVAFPGEHAFRAERAAFVGTVESLTDDEFEHGKTLCEGWAPRDVLAHVIGIDDELGTYVRLGGRITAANNQIVERYRARSRDELQERARRWAVAPATWVRPLSWQYLGDLSVHHQDVLRPLGRTRPLPRIVRNAILREGAILGIKKLPRYRVEPTDGGRAFGRGRRVRGTSEALGLWLAGREGIEPELVFDQHQS
jgi:uncharacterized protein (TIGR03083 family)